MSMSVRDEKILLVIRQFRCWVWKLWLQVIKEMIICRSRQYTETSSSHQQCHQVIDEKISDRIVVSSIKSRDYSVQRSSDSLITLIYWENLNSSSLLDVKSYIYLREKLRAQESNQNAFSSIDQSQTLNDCDRTFILTIYSTSTWYKSSQEKKRIIQYNHTLSSHHAHLSFITYFSAQWMTIIEQENAVFDITITSITSAMKSTSRSKIKDRSIVV